MGESPTRRWSLIGGLLALTGVMMLVGGPAFCGIWVYVGVAAALLFPAAQAVGLAILLAVVMLILTRDDPGGSSWELALTLVALTVWMSAFTRNILLTAELESTRDQLAAAAVAAERSRIARDLHDILGHSLTGIAVKAGLARRLVERDPAAATREITDIERLAREALADVRSTAAGIRGTSLAGELAAAAAMLRAAGIRPVLPQAVDEVIPAGREVFGFVVREAVTNVVRHSGASVCTITLGPERIEIADDGRGLGHMPGGGRGLLGLAERVRAAGGELRAGPRAEGGFAVVATVAWT
jgi:two-component system sensor histidine kinase DesK